jgi:glycolate oxidase iron-sulfur subunit
MKNETHSPRGRINLIKMLGEGRITDVSVLEEPLDMCLDCRACETACPTGVEYGSLLEAARAAIVKRKKFSAPVRLLRETTFKRGFPSRTVMNAAGNTFWLYKKTKLQKAARATGVLKKLPFHLGNFEAVMPKPVSPKERKRMPQFLKAEGEKKYAVAFFTGCVMDAVFHKINQLSVKLLAKAGCDVFVFPDQTCCGALQAHSGELDLTIQLAKRNIAAFEKENIDFIVNNAGGCGAMLVEYAHLLSDDEEWAERALEFSKKTKDISEILILSEVINHLTARKDERITYQPSCHLTNVVKITREPVELLSRIRGIQLNRMEQENMCCGSAGIYNLVHYEASMEILDEKMAHVKKTKPAVIITTNPGCLLQMKLGIERENLSASVRALHLIEYLAECAEIDGF